MNALFAGMTTVLLRGPRATSAVTPAKAGVHKESRQMRRRCMDSGLRRNDGVDGASAFASPTPG